MKKTEEGSQVRKNLFLPEHRHKTFATMVKGHFPRVDKFSPVFWPCVLKTGERPMWAVGAQGPEDGMHATFLWCGHRGGPAAGGWTTSTPLSPWSHWERSFPSQETISFSFPLVCCVYSYMLEDLHPLSTSVSNSVLLSLVLIQKLYQHRRELGLWGGESWWTPTAEKMVDRQAGPGDAVACSCSAAAGP